MLFHLPLVESPPTHHVIRHKGIWPLSLLHIITCVYVFFIIITPSNFVECWVDFVGVCRRDLWKLQH